MTPKQMSLWMQNDVGFEPYGRRMLFLAEVDRVVRWVALRAVIALYYPKASQLGVGVKLAVMGVAPDLIATVLGGI